MIWIREYLENDCDNLLYSETLLTVTRLVNLKIQKVSIFTTVLEKFNNKLSIGICKLIRLLDTNRFILKLDI